MTVHEASLATTVLGVLRQHPGADHVRVHVGDLSTPADELAATLRTHLAGATPAIEVGEIEVVPRARQRICSACAHPWTSADLDPECPACAVPPLPLPHDHTIEVEILGGWV